jgi:hypothetical protein
MRGRRVIPGTSTTPHELGRRRRNRTALARCVGPLQAKFCYPPKRLVDARGVEPRCPAYRAGDLPADLRVEKLALAAGFEPASSRLTAGRTTCCAKPERDEHIGSPGRIRTGDRLVRTELLLH